MRRRRLLWVLVAVVLFAAAAWLMLRGEEEEPVTTAKDRISLPTHLTAKESQRMRERQTWVPPPIPDAGLTQLPPRPRDPMLAAITAKEGETALVLEANAVRNSPIGDLLVACLTNRGQLSKLKEDTGIDVTQDLDRVAAWDKGLMVSGNFKGLKLPDRNGEAPIGKEYGDARLFKEGKDGVVELPDGGTRLDPTTFVIWKDQMLMVADDENAAKEMVDRLEGRAQNPGPPLINDDMAYGEVYGVIAANDLAKLLPEEDQNVKQLLTDAAARVELHADTSSDIGIVADVTGPGADKVQDLGKSLAGALSLARVRAQVSDDKDLAELLDLAKVVPRDGRFRLEMGVPLALLQKRLAFCLEENADAGD